MASLRVVSSKELRKFWASWSSSSVMSIYYLLFVEW